MINDGMRGVIKAVATVPRCQAHTQVQVIEVRALKATNRLPRVASDGHVESDEMPQRRDRCRKPLVGTAENPVKICGKPIRSFGLVFRESCSSYCNHAGIFEDPQQLVDPVRFRTGVIVNEGNNVTLTRLGRGVSCRPGTEPTTRPVRCLMSLLSVEMVAVRVRNDSHLRGRCVAPLSASRGLGAGRYYQCRSRSLAPARSGPEQHRHPS